MTLPRSSAVLLHPTSLPAIGGIGDFGPAAYRFADFLAAARQRFWQILPLSPTDSNHSPYSATSAFAGNPLLISLEKLAESGWIAREKLEALPTKVARVDYPQVEAAKLPLLRQAALNFLHNAPDFLRGPFNDFCAHQRWWLEDFVLFDALRKRHNSASWNQWSAGLARRDAAALQEAREEMVEELAIGRILQFAFFQQWRDLRAYCSQKGIGVIGDVAIFVNHDSSDVWTHPEIFYLNEDMTPQLVSGVPPDIFSHTGQRWGNPLYRWDVLQAQGYQWWVQRIRHALETCDVIRLDHFIGFVRYWEIPAAETTAINGRWVDGPKDLLFRALKQALGELPFIAEDLGAVTPEIIALRNRLGLPGMRILQFGFGDRHAHFNLPQNFERNCVVYTGTHDNDTTVGWFSSASEIERAEAIALLGGDKHSIHWSFIRAAAASVADLCVIPLQDILGLGTEARMNYPSRASGNWDWRFAVSQLTQEIALKLKKITEVTDRG